MALRENHRSSDALLLSEALFGGALAGLSIAAALWEESLILPLVLGGLLGVLLPFAAALGLRFWLRAKELEPKDANLLTAGILLGVHVGVFFAMLDGFDVGPREMVAVIEALLGQAD